MEKRVTALHLGRLRVRTGLLSLPQFLQTVYAIAGLDNSLDSVDFRVGVFELRVLRIVWDEGLSALVGVKTDGTLVDLQKTVVVQLVLSL